MRNNRSAPGSAVLLVLLLAPFLAQADATIANVATPSIQSGLGASAAATELVIGGYLTAYAVLLITGARLGQTHGYHRLFLLGGALFGLTSLACGLAPTPWVLVVARVLQGASAAMMYPQALTGIQLTFSGPARTRAISAFALALAGGAVSGQILGGALIEADIAGSGWRSIFLVNVPICVVLLVAGSRVLPRAEHQPGKGLDLTGVALLTVALVLIVLPLAMGRTAGWPAWTFVAMGVGLLTVGLFLYSQRRVAARGGNPLLNLHVVARPAIYTGLASLLIATGTYYALLFTLAQYLQQGAGRSALFSGLALVPWVAAFGLAGQLTRRLPDRLRPVFPVLGYTLMAVVFVGLALTLFTGTMTDTVMMVLLAVGGFGLGVGFNGLLGHLTGSVPTRYAPDISGVSTTTLQVGGALGVAALGTVYLTLAEGSSGAVASHAFGVTNVLYAACALAAALLGVVAVRTRGLDDEPEDVASATPAVPEVVFVSGTVVTEDETGAVVTLVDYEGHQGGRTDAVDGTYQLPLPSAGPWQLVVAAPGHQPQVRRVVADDGGHVAEHFDLTSDPDAARTPAGVR